MNKKKLISVIIIFAILLGSYFYYSSYQKVTVATQSPIMKVSATMLTYQVLPKTIFSYGAVISPDSVELKAQTSDIVTALNFVPGQTVQKGDVIFTIKSNDTDKQLEKLAAQMESSKQQYMRLLKAEELVPGTIVPNVLQQQKFQYQQDLAAYDEAKQIHSVTVPISGILTDTDIAAGDFVNVGDRLATIVNSKKLQIGYQVSHEYANQVHIGQAVNFISDHKVYSAKVSYVAPQLNSENDTLSLRANFISSVDLLPNTFGQVDQVVNPDKKVLAVSQDLVQTDTQGFYIYILKDNKVTKNYFSPGELTKQGFYEVSGGLKVDDLIITTDPKTLAPNQEVRVAQQ